MSKRWTLEGKFYILNIPETIGLLINVFRLFYKRYVLFIVIFYNLKFTEDVDLELKNTLSPTYIFAMSKIKSVRNENEVNRLK